VDNFDEYSGCAVKYECGGGCRAFAYALYGRLDGPPDPVTCVWKKGLAEFSKLSEQDQDPWNRRLGYVVRQIQGGTCEKGAVFQAGGIPYRQFPVQSCFFHWHGLSLLFTGLFFAGDAAVIAGRRPAVAGCPGQHGVGGGGFDLYNLGRRLARVVPRHGGQAASGRVVHEEYTWTFYWSNLRCRNKLRIRMKLIL